MACQRLARTFMEGCKMWGCTYLPEGTFQKVEVRSTDADARRYYDVTADDGL